uniref:Photosystem I assembly protein Ycf4 n=2 Tax=Syringa TaxID=24208 RepID=A0A4D5Y2V5_9LAMI|nr:Ycf4 protein [Syringa pubescens subsp. microphylla]QSQ71700.1 hypothetical protein [Syringa pubescens subsp. microphylla]
MNWRSKDIWLELIKGSRKLISNFCWALILFLGSLGFLLIGISSYLGRKLLFFVPSQQFFFLPQGLVMSFYGMAGLFISSYLWCAICWNVGSGYDQFDRKGGVVCIFRWGFPGKNRRVFFRVNINDINGISLEFLRASRTIYLETTDKDLKEGLITLMRSGANLTPREVEKKAIELSDFLRVPLQLIKLYPDEK